MAKRRKADPASKARAEFVSEAEEILERMRDDLSSLAEDVAAEREASPDVVNRLFRSAHSLKGLSGLFGHESLGDLAHHLEDILDRLRMGRATLDAAALALFDEAVVAISNGLEKLGDGETDDAALGDLVARIERWTAAPVAPVETDDALDVPESLLGALTEYEEHRLRENLARGRGIYVVTTELELSAFEEGLAELSAAIREVGEVLSTLPSPGECAESQIRFSLLVATDRPAAEVAGVLDLPGVSIRGVAGARPAPPAAPEDGPEPARGEARAGLVDEGPVQARDPAAEPRGPESLQSLSETVRVDIRKLDELMNLVGELVIQREALAGFVARLASEPATARRAGDLARIHKDLDRRLRELQAAVVEVRMVPLRQVFEKVARVVRRLRVELGKDVRLEVQGADTELDKLIVEDLVDPLMHIVRNALDHAIEGVDERRAAGKPPQGLVRIDAFQRGNHVVIAVSDDGRGIDRAALRARAESKGLVQPGEALGDREITDLVFVPGISTRAEVTDTSGRGVGMDVVRTNVTLLGGVVDVDSIPGRGTTVSLTLPITLAIIPSIVVEADGQRFAVPLGAVQETLIVDPAEIQRSEGRELLDLRGQPLPLRRLAAEFGLRPPPADAKLFALVLGMGDARLGLLVDRLEGQQDAVIKPIHGPIPAVRGIAGAAELGGPNPVLVLDASALLAEAQGRREGA